MLEFIKMFGLGILYTLLFPFILVFFALSVVYVIINYLVAEIVNFFGFFFGHTFTVETKLEKQLKEMKEEKVNSSEIVIGNDSVEDIFAQNSDSNNEPIFFDFGEGSDDNELR